MNTKFKARPWALNKQLLFRIIYVAVYIAFCIPLFIFVPIFGVIFIIPAFVAVLAMFTSNIRYYIGEKNLLIKRPIFHKRYIPYTAIKKAEQLNSEQALQKIQKLYTQHTQGKIPGEDFAYITMYATTGTLYSPGEPGRTETTVFGKTTTKYGKAYMGYAQGEFLLLTIHEDNRDKYLFLSPKDYFGFYSELKSKI